MPEEGKSKETETIAGANVSIFRGRKFLFRSAFVHRIDWTYLERRIASTSSPARLIEDSSNPCRVMPVSEFGGCYVSVLPL